jgi:hypothetical protein
MTASRRAALIESLPSGRSGSASTSKVSPQSSTTSPTKSTSSPQRMRRHGSESQDPRRRKRAAHRGSDRNHDLSADSALLEQPHGVGRLVKRIAPVHARDDLAVFDEAGEPFEVGGALFRHEQHQTLPQEG